MEVRRLTEKEMTKYRYRMSTGRFLAGGTGRNVLMYEAFDSATNGKGSALVETHGNSVSLKYISVDADNEDSAFGTHFITSILFDLRSDGYRSFDMEFFEQESPEILGIADELNMEIEETGHEIYHISLLELESRVINGNISDYMKKWGILSIGDAPESLLNDLREQINESEYAPAENPMDALGLEKRLSLVHSENGSADGAIFIERTGRDLYISFLWSGSDDLFLAERLIDTAVTLAFERYAPNTGVSMAVKNEKLNYRIRKELGVSGDKMRSASCDLRELDLYIAD